MEIMRTIVFIEKKLNKISLEKLIKGERIFQTKIKEDNGKKIFC